MAKRALSAMRRNSDLVVCASNAKGTWGVNIFIPQAYAALEGPIYTSPGNLVNLFSDLATVNLTFRISLL
jgi:hypothetical protein